MKNFGLIMENWRGFKKLAERKEFMKARTFKEALDYHAAWNSSLISGQDMEAAMKAFMEKSEANYDDLEPIHSFWEKDGLVP